MFKNDNELKLSSKAEVTRARIEQVAFTLFTERGYRATTMRTIAQRAGVSLGNAYYYFPSKEAIVFAFYELMFRQQMEAAAADRPSKTSFGQRLETFLSAYLQAIEPFHQLAGEVVTIAVHPLSALNPFSGSSRDLRDRSIAIMQSLLGPAEVQRHPLSNALPYLLWLCHLGVTLFWIYDQSPDRQKTRRFIRKASPLIAQLVRITRLKVLKPLLAPLRSLVNFTTPGMEATP